ncbi:repellent protein 1-like [Temnothorax curvispinosus]|uniref:Repellent protein 1-like n=1 Tax=Temnothorax curvispinosus TaxID=300111 RepID=A0A6J1Q9Y1_9HYME|nr:repellent protein 1-like [Temnothorax curvispinosus]
MEAEWTECRVLALIEDIKQYPCLWDPKDKDYKSRNRKFDCLKILSVKYECSPVDIKKKWSNLLQSYRACRRKIKSSKKSGAGRDDIYKPTWFAFDHINSFMTDMYIPHGTLDSINQEKDSDEENNAEILQNENIETNEVEVIDIGQTSTNIKQEVKVFSSLEESSKVKKKKRQTQIDERIDEAYSYLAAKKRKEETSEKRQKDECDIFGELIVTKLRKLDDYTRQLIMNDINTIMFRATIQPTQNFQRDNFTQPNTFIQSPLSPVCSYSVQSSPIVSSQPSPNISYTPHPSPNTSYTPQPSPNTSYTPQPSPNSSYTPQPSPNTSYTLQPSTSASHTAT